MATQISKRQITVLSEADLKPGKNIIYIVSSGGQPTAPNVARLLARKAHNLVGMLWYVIQRAKLKKKLKKKL